MTGLLGGNTALVLTCSLIAGLGVFLVYAGLSSFFGVAVRNTLAVGDAPRSDVVLTDLPPLLQRAVGPLLTDLGRALFGRGKALDLLPRLRQSGWRYASLEDYWGSQMAFLVAGVFFGLTTWLLLNLPAGALVVLPVACGFGGYLIPGQNVKDAIDRRRKALTIEMAWSLDRLAAGLRAGRGLEVSIERVLAWSAGGGGGLFTALLRDIVAGLSTHALDFERYLDDLRQGLPGDLPEIDEFLQICKLNKRGQAVAAQLEGLAAAMREGLNNRVTQVAQAAERRVQILGPGVILLVAVLLGAGLPMVMLLGN